jgi:hypothetical protein
MEIVGAIVLAGIFSILTVGIYMNLRGGAFARSLSSCPACGCKVSVRADPENSRLVLQCENGDCGKISFRHVRASALSLFGVARFLLVFLTAALFYWFAGRMDWSLKGRLFAFSGGILVVWIFVSFLIRLAAHIILEFNPSPIWKSEIVAHLAPPPFWQGQEGRKISHKKDNSAESKDIPSRFE